MYLCLGVSGFILQHGDVITIHGKYFFNAENVFLYLDAIKSVCHYPKISPRKSVALSKEVISILEKHVRFIMANKHFTATIGKME